MVEDLLNMRSSDIIAPTYRETAVLLWRGVTLEELLLYWGGDERGSDYAGPREDFPISIPVGTHPLHAVGAAYAFKLRREERAAVPVFGDGATSKGDVWEAFNFAGAMRLPVVFVVINLSLLRIKRREPAPSDVRSLPMAVPLIGALASAFILVVSVW